MNRYAEAIAFKIKKDQNKEIKIDDKNSERDKDLEETASRFAESCFDEIDYGLFDMIGRTNFIPSIENNRDIELKYSFNIKPTSFVRQNDRGFKNDLLNRIERKFINEFQCIIEKVYCNIIMGDVFEIKITIDIKDIKNLLEFI
jgi:hypothetical protein